MCRRARAVHVRPRHTFSYTERHVPWQLRPSISHCLACFSSADILPYSSFFFCCFSSSTWRLRLLYLGSFGFTTVDSPMSMGCQASPSPGLSSSVGAFPLSYSQFPLGGGLAAALNGASNGSHAATRRGNCKPLANAALGGSTGVATSITSHASSMTATACAFTECWRCRGTRFHIRTVGGRLSA